MIHEQAVDGRLNDCVVKPGISDHGHKKVIATIALKSYRLTGTRT